MVNETMNESMNKSMSESIELRPMSVGDLLDAAFRLYRRHFWLFVGIVAVIQVPLTALEVIYETLLGPAERIQAVVNNSGRLWPLYRSPDDYYGDVWQLMAVRLLFVALSFFAVQGLMNGAMARAIYDRYLGRPRGLVDTYRALGWRWLRLAAALLLLGILDFCFLLLVLIPCVGWIAALILLILFNVPILSFLAPVIVIEDKGAFAGMGRAFTLGRRKFWRVLGVNILLWLLTTVLSLALPLLTGVFFALWDPGFDLQTILASLVELVISLLVMPVWVCGMTLLYFDLRVRLEGFDLELRMERLQTGVEQNDLLLKARRHLDKAYDYEENKAFEKALRECEAAIQLAPKWAEAHNLRGILLEELDRLEEAIEAYRGAIHLAPAFVEAKKNLAEAEADLASGSQ